jgi:transcriptional regulator with XRE-family HTH domain
LAEFLRARRERLSPAEVGFPDSGRRRTPGLRREEVATLAGVSIDYLVRLEQGRDTNPSPSVLNALAIALRLTDEEKVHMAGLAAHGRSPELCPAATDPVTEVPATVRALLARLAPTPAFVVGPYGDVLAYNDPWERLVAPLGMLDGPAPNLARYVFLHPSAPTVYPDWEAAADEQVSRIRSASTRWREDERFVSLLAELSELPAFATRWAVAEKRRGEMRIVHPTAGELRIAYEVLLLPDDGEQRLVTWLPADARTESAFGGASRPARLRVVGER